MGNITVIVLVVVGAIWGLSLFLGYIGSIKKSFDTRQEIEATHSTELRKKQKQIAEDAEEQRKRFMEDIKNKTRNYENQF